MTSLERELTPEEWTEIKERRARRDPFARRAGTGFGAHRADARGDAARRRSRECRRRATRPRLALSLYANPLAECGDRAEVRAGTSPTRIE
jgi:hypothetical protein